jgi:L-lactate dehydrogenase complex protein LldG
MKTLLEALHTAVDDQVLREGVRRATEVAEPRTIEILRSMPWIEKLAREVEEAKRKVIENLDYFIELTVKALRASRAEVYIASTAEEARDIVAKIVGKGKTVVMSKSMTAEEIGLREHLERLGNRVWETDLGQLLVQISSTRPMHVLAPAIHITREEAARLVRSRLGLELKTDKPEEIVAAVRLFLRRAFVEADVGISGANAIAADTGSIVLVENEGNIRLVTGLPPVHIVVAGVEKIVPTLLDALKAAMVQAAYGSIFPPTYINVITGPSSTADIEHVRVYGAHGPQQLHVVLVDNGRVKASKHDVLREQLRCIRCGRCQISCPLWRVVANHWGGSVYGGPMGLGWTAITEGVDKAAEASMLCLLCKRCDEVCPMRIPLSGIARWLKRYYVRRAGASS